MSSSGSITQWLNQLQAGEQAAVQRLWEEYFHRLVGLARKKLQGLPRKIADEEDVALSAFKSFCRAAENGRFPQLADSNDLWQVLVMLTLRKAVNLRQYETRDKRDFRLVQDQAGVARGDPGLDSAVFSELIQSGEPSPAVVAEITEQYQVLLQKLADDRLRQIAVRKMEGYTNKEIARQLGCAESTIERRLGLIRKVWERQEK
jgi:DNA-directed RNA polymerase specialized sigma24 family protein